MNILAIGNSFSQDATRYLHEVMRAGGVDSTVVNLYIGGCSLKRHWDNAQADAQDYLYELNGVSQDRYVSIDNALREREWDVITLQQASHDSGMKETYEPYLSELIAYVRQRAPHARLLMHQTWAYEIDSTHSEFGRYNHSQNEMYERLSAAYAEAAKAHGMEIIPCGDAVQAVRGREPFIYGQGGMSLCRDGFHMSLVYGRMLLALSWYARLTGRSAADIDYMPCPPLAPEGEAGDVDAAALRVLGEAADEVCARA